MPRFSKTMPLDFCFELEIMKENEVILHMAAEGGGLTLYGCRVGDRWQFSRDMMDHTPELIDEATIQHTSEVVATWQEALTLLDEYPWYMLTPTKVHLEFGRIIYNAALERLQGQRFDNPNRLRQWQRACIGGT